MGINTPSISQITVSNLQYFLRHVDSSVFVHNNTYKHDSRIDPGNRYKDIFQGTSVTRPFKMAFDIYDET